MMTDTADPRSGPAQAVAEPSSDPPPKAPRSGASWRKRVIRTAILLALLYFFGIPIIRLTWLSFSEPTGYGLSNYTEILSRRDTWVSVYNTMYTTVISTVMATILGVVFAWLVAYTDIGGKKLMQPLIVLPFILPPYVVTLAWAHTFGRNGLGSTLLGLLPFDIDINMYSLNGISYVLGITHFPIVYLLVVGVMRRIPREMEQASRASGAGRWVTLRKVTLVAAMPGIAAGGLLAFLTGLDNFGVPAFLGIPANINVLSTSIYQQVVGFGPSAFYRAAALSVLLGVIAIAGTAVQWAVVRRSNQSETVDADPHPRVRLVRGRRIIQVLVWGFLLFINVIPLLSMIMTSLSPALGVATTFSNASWKQYASLLQKNNEMRSALATSGRLALLAMVICLVVGTYIAYVRTRQASRLSKIVDAAVALPYALPGIVMALAIIFAWVQPLPGVFPGIYGTWVILLVAYVTRFTFYQVRSSSAAFSQIDRQIEEAARSSGAGTFATWRRIMVPLLLSGLAAGAGLVFLTAVSELTVSSILYSANAKTIGVVIFSFEQAGYSNLSTAASTVVLVVYALVGLLGLVLHSYFKRRTGGK